MTWVTFFLTVFCGIFGAYVLLKTAYNALVSMIIKGRAKNAGNKRRIHNDQRNG